VPSTLSWASSSSRAIKKVATRPVSGVLCWLFHLGGLAGTVRMTSEMVNLLKGRDTKARV
jgi:hypothetical protein